MTIEEAKTNLEKQIIFWDGIVGIGVVNSNNSPLIEIAVDKNNKTILEKLNTLIKNNNWHEYTVNITSADGLKFH